MSGESWEAAVSGDAIVSRDVISVTDKTIFLSGNAFDSGALAPMKSLDVGQISPNDDRGWRGKKRVSFEQVDDPAAADFTLSIATPTTTDALCAPLETIGMWNCCNGTNVVLNSDRWTYGSPIFSSVEAYHVYEINHEVGHFLGHEHEYCAGAGLTSPVMAQQSRTREGGCTENGWPTRDNQAP